MFVDTSAWYAAIDSGDQSSERARDILSRGDKMVTTDHVLLETWLLLDRRIEHTAAEQFWDGLRKGIATIECVTAGDLEIAWLIGEKFPDQKFSITDRTSFAVMQRLGVHNAATFDNDFSIFRFGPRQERAFTVLR